MFAATPVSVIAEGEHSRRVGSELLVLLGDVEKLRSGGQSDKHQRGLRNRIAGSLSGLPLLLRLADQERGRFQSQPDFDRWRQLLVENTLSKLAEQISSLSAAYPFEGIGILPAQASSPRIQNALKIHNSLCAACHDFASLDTERPALNLYTQARELGEREFAARMVVGVRGDVVTGLGNPFTDEEIAALIVLYRSYNNSAEAGGR